MRPARVAARPRPSVHHRLRGPQVGKEVADLGVREGLQLSLGHERRAQDPPLLDLYYKDDALGDPLLSEARLERLELVTPAQMETIRELAFRVNGALRQLFAQVGLELVDFKIELGFTTAGELVVADEISPDTCRLWNRAVSDAEERILDKDRFRQDLGGVVEAYGEVLKRVQGVCPDPRVYR
jgi:phosphoribosylaminoimidazole-succinocarboxamide synthase